MKLQNWLIIFLIAYATFLIVNIEDSHLDADEGAHAMTGLFFNRLINDWLSHPTLNPSAIYSYVFAYYARYPKFVFQYGPIYPLINSFFAQTQFLLRLLNIFCSCLILFFTFKINKKLFDEKIAFISVLVLGTSAFFVKLATSITPNIPAFLFFTIGFYFYLKRRESRFFSIISGLFFGLSVLTKEFTIVYVGAVCLVTLRGFKTAKKSNLLLFASIAIPLITYFTVLYAVGALDILLSYPSKQAWYGSIAGHPQWTQLSGWLYSFLLVNHFFTIIGLIAFIIGLFFLAQKGEKNLFYFLLIVYLAITIVNNKTIRRLLPATIFIAPIIGLGFERLFKKFNNYFIKTLIIFFFCLMLFFTPIERGGSVPAREVAIDLINDCPNCTVLIASEVNDVHSSSLMYESLVKDEKASLRFIRPTVFDSLTIQEVVNSELVNRVIIVGDVEFLMNTYPNELLFQDKIDDYVGQAIYVIDNYDLIKEYDSDFVNKIYVFDTGINETKKAPFCATALSLNNSFCTNYSSPIEALTS